MVPCGKVVSMTPVRQRRAMAALCIALVVFSAFLPTGLADSVWVELIPLGFVVSLIAVVTIARAASRCDEQTVSLLSLALLRAPPASHS
jgi:hypothetical protein